MKNRFLPLFTFAGLLIAPSESNAALIAYDGFDYAGGVLNGASGGTGWATNWSGATGANVATPTTSLSYSSGSVSVSGGASSAVASGEASPLASRTFAAQTGTVYFSFLLRYESGGAGGTFESNDFLQFGFNDDTNVANSGSIGKLSNNTRFGARIGGANGGGTTESALNMTSFTTFLLVGKMSKSAVGGDYDTMELFVNPTSLTEPTTPTAVDVATAGFSSFTYFTLRTSSVEADDRYFFDELRIGDSFADVVVPEPSSALLGLGAFGLTALRRRRG